MRFSTYTLHNGVQVAATDLPDSNSITMLVLVKAGSIHEHISGLAHFIEHTVFKGTKKRPTAFDINDEVERVGGYVNAATSQEFTEFYIKMPAQYYKIAGDILFDILFSPLFEEHELEKEKDVIIEEINMYEDMSVRSVSDTFYSIVWPHEKWGKPILGTPHSVKSITRDDVLRFMRKYYTPENLIISIAGPLGEKHIDSMLTGTFGTLEMTSEIAALPLIPADDSYKKNHSVEIIDTKDRMIRIEKRPVRQTHLCLGFKAISYHDDREYPLEVASSLLGEGTGSYLWQKIREELGASYYLDCEIDAFHATGIWYVHTGVDNDKLYEVIRIIMDGFTRLKEGNFADSEVYRAKEYLKGDFLMNLEGSEELARYCAHEMLERMHIRSAEEELAAIDAVGRQEVSAVAESICNGKIFFNLLTKQEDISRLEKVLNM